MFPETQGRIANYSQSTQAVEILDGTEISRPASAGTNGIRLKTLVVSGDKRIHPDLETQLDDVRFSLADIVARGEYNDFGIFRILNRIAFASTVQLIFIIYRDEGDRLVVEEDVSAFDPVLERILWRDLVNGFKVRRKSGAARARRGKPFAQKFTYRPELERLFVPEAHRDDQNREERQLNKDAVENYKIRWFDTDFHILAFALRVTDRKIGQQPRIEFDPVQNKSPLWKFLRQSLHHFDGQQGRVSFGPSSDMQSRLKDLRTKGRLQKAKNYPPEKVPLNREDLKPVLNTLNGLCDVAYDRIALSPVVRNFLANEPTPKAQHGTNVHLFCKVFQRTELRYSAYLFDSCYALGSTQHTRLVASLKRFSGMEKRFIPFADQDQHRRFWSAVENAKPEEITSALRQPLSTNVRLFTENALMSGTIMVKPRIFERGGLLWFDDKASISDDERDRELFRAACLHFVLQMGSPVPPISDDGTVRNLAVVAYPFRCNGAIWQTAAFVRPNNDCVIAGEATRLLHKDVFQREFLAYHAIYRDVERRSRRKAKFAYLDLAEGMIYHAARAAGGAIGAQEAQRLNEEFLTLSRVFPFPRIFLVDREARWDVGLKPNDFFSRLSLREFIEKEQTRIRFSRAIMLARADAVDPGTDHENIY